MAIAKRASATTGRNAPRKTYSAAWTRLFAVLDPEHQGPTSFLAELGWDKKDLARATKGETVDAKKLMRLYRFCLDQRLSLPLTGATKDELDALLDPVLDLLPRGR